MKILIVAERSDGKLRRVSAEIAATGANYLLSWFAFGDMTLKESLASLELFAREVMPAFAEASAG